jgi:hypothetical protein
MRFNTVTKAEMVEQTFLGDDAKERCEYLAHELLCNLKASHLQTPPAIFVMHEIHWTEKALTPNGIGAKV